MIFQKPTDNMQTEVWVKINGEDIRVGSVDQMNDFYSTEIRTLEKIAKKMIDTTPKKTVEKLSMADAKLNKKTKVMSFHFDGGSWPDELEIISHITGVVAKFRRASYEHPLHDQDGWDGEGALYSAVNPADTQWCVMMWHG
jgi:hypothetical protein